MKATTDIKTEPRVGTTTLGKALSVNQDPQIYGAFAEIGAGQEVARFFFQAGQASHTIAKTISAYDMIYSDEIYGKEKNGRYVCESRLKKMLDKEFSLLQRRLQASRGDRTTFFAYANTVATGDVTKRYSHGWIGIRFQKTPFGPSNDIIAHVRLMDKYRLQQQEALGILGVNLVAAAFQCIDHPERIVSSLVDNIKFGQISIDLIRFEGPDLRHLNNNLMNLELVRKGLSDGILFGPDQHILSVSDALFNKSIILQRGTFRPVTNTHLDVLLKGTQQFEQDFPEDNKNWLTIFEITMNRLQIDGHVNEKDFLDRVRSLTTLGGHVLVSNFYLFYRLKRYLRQYTSKPIVIISGASHLPEIFDETKYRDLEGGMLEGLGKLLDNNTRLYIYPHKKDEVCTTAKTFFPNQNVKHIYQHFIERQLITDISGCEKIDEYITSQNIREWIRDQNPKWEKNVPAKIRELIEKENLFDLSAGEGF
jgi:hypothetical protein